MTSSFREASWSRATRDGVEVEHPILTAIRRASFTPLGWFAPAPDDRVPGDARFIVLIGNAGPEMFRRFARERDPGRDSLDRWTRDVIGGLAAELDARAVYPFDADPPWPFLTWARQAGGGHVSPLGLNIHSIYGLWHAYRAALLFPVAFDLPTPSPGSHPCETCVGRPCLTTCPVQAFDGSRYDVSACAGHIATHDGQACMTGGCQARHACPVGRGLAYDPSQAAFHMKAFLAARQGA
jgi:epoxyqueuosine reductase QueG